MKRFLLLTIFLIAPFAFGSVTVTVNGSNHTIPQTNERGWGNAVTAWIQAITTYTLQPTGGTFTLTNDVNFGGSYGLKSAYFSTRTANPSSAGLLRLAVSDSIGWRNNANGANLLLSVDGSNRLTWDSSVLLAASTTATLTNKTIDGDDNTVQDLPVTSIKTVLADASKVLVRDGSGVPGSALLVNANVDASAAIARTKLASGTNNHVLINNGSGVMSSEAQLATSRGGTGQDFSGSTGVLKVSAGTASAASIVNADIDASAAIARSKIATGSNSHVVINDGSGNLSSEATLAISRGGTGQATAEAGLNALLPSQGGNSGKFLSTNGTTHAWTTPGGTQAISTKTSAYTLTSSDDTILADPSSSSFTLTIPAASDVSGKVFTIEKLGSSPNVVSLSGGFTFPLYTSGESWRIHSDGSAWHVLVHGVPSYVSVWQTLKQGDIAAVTTAPTLGTLKNSQWYWYRDGRHIVNCFKLKGQSGQAAGSGDYIWPVPEWAPIDLATMPATISSAPNIDAGSAMSAGPGTAWGNMVLHGSQSGYPVAAWPYHASGARIEMSDEGVNGSGSKPFSTSMGYHPCMRLPVSGWRD
jgi:hypothetical protein